MVSTIRVLGDVPVKSWTSLIFRRLLLVLAGLAVMLSTTAGSWTGEMKVVTYTQTLSGTTNTFSFPPANPCGGQPRTISLTSNGSFRITMVQSGPLTGYYWLTPLQKGTFEILPQQASEPKYAGNFELQADDANHMHKGQITFFLHLTGVGSDGSQLNTRLLEQLSVSANKVTISMASPAFLATRLSCG